MEVKFHSSFPVIPSNIEMMMLQGMTYKVTLTLPDELDPSQVRVQAWTSQCDREHPEGHWHEVDLPCLEQDGVNENIYSDENVFTYGTTKVITSDKNFEFTFRWKVSQDIQLNTDWSWSHGYGVNCYSTVLPCRQEDKWTLEPNFDHIVGALYLGNFIAATHAKKCGFTHVINTAENLDVVFHNNDVVYHKVNVKDGASNPIEEYKILDAVQWIKKHDKEGNFTALLVFRCT